jgi:hypothetical protein
MDSSEGRVFSLVSSTAPVPVVLRGTADFPVGGLFDKDMVVSSTARVPVLLIGSENSSVDGVAFTSLAVPAMSESTADSSLGGIVANAMIKAVTSIALVLSMLESTVDSSFLRNSRCRHDGCIYISITSRVKGHCRFVSGWSPCCGQ